VPQSPPTSASSSSSQPATAKRRSAPRPLLSKSRYVSGLQCEKRLWLEVRNPELGVIDGGQRAALSAGTAVGELARGLYPGGVLVEEGPGHFGAALERTRALLADPSVPAIFEGAFACAGVRVRADVLVRLANGGWRLVEVKAGTRVKDVYVDDLTIQCFVLEGSGLPLEACELLHVNADYVRGCGGIHWPAYFRRTDLTLAARLRLHRVPERLSNFDSVVHAEFAPAREPGAQCSKPYGCPFRGHCTAAKPDDWVGNLPRISRRHRTLLSQLGVERIGDIPWDFPLSRAQRRVCDVVRGESPRFAETLAGALRAAGPPARYLDFEAMSPAVPLYAGTRPYQRIPFQYSLHRVDGAGALRQTGFLARPEAGDPRRLLAERLLAAVGPECDEPILVYSSYEAGVVAELAREFPDLAAPLGKLRARLFDLLAVVREHVYHPAFAGSFSLKTVAPVLVPEIGYADLDDVTGGGEAALAFERMARGEVVGDEAAALREALEAYCACDTLALAKLHHVLLTADEGGET
jgi:hypothetical protein